MCGGRCGVVGYCAWGDRFGVVGYCAWGDRCGVVGYCAWGDRCGVSGKFIFWKWRIGQDTGIPRNFVWGVGGFQQFQLRTEERGNGDLGAVPPSQGFWRQL